MTKTQLLPRNWPTPYAEELQKLTGRLAVTEAQQRRLFFEQQMNKAKDEFAKAEMSVKQAQDKGGLASVDAQTQSMIGAAAQIRGQIVAREVQLQAIRAYAGPENPDPPALDFRTGRAAYPASPARRGRPPALPPAGQLTPWAMCVCTVN
jgi:hypothetical protein